MTIVVNDSCPNLNGGKKRYNGLEEALIRASFHNDTDLAIQLLNYGAQPNYVAEATGETPLLIAFSRSNLPLAERLVSAGASKDFPSRKGITPSDDLKLKVGGSPFPVSPSVAEFVTAATNILSAAVETKPLSGPKRNITGPRL